jgi:hypothetical protein
LLVFLLASSSIGCLLADFYKLCPMRLFTPFILLPCMVLLFVFAALDRWKGTRELWRAVWIGTIAGLLAAVGYDLFRLPFVFAHQWGIDSIVPSMNLFKMFPAFGAMVLGEPAGQSDYSLVAHIVGWIYHFSNGATFGVMYLAMVGGESRRHWGWAVVFALGLELAMLSTPYSATFNIPLTTQFILVTIAAHAIFGIVLGLSSRSLGRRPSFTLAAA